jgi:hypothetical protein
MCLPTEGCVTHLGANPIMHAQATLSSPHGTLATIFLTVDAEFRNIRAARRRIRRGAAIEIITNTVEREPCAAAPAGAAGSLEG